MFNEERHHNVRKLRGGGGGGGGSGGGGGGVGGGGTPGGLAEGKIEKGASNNISGKYTQLFTNSAYALCSSHLTTAQSSLSIRNLCLHYVF